MQVTISFDMTTTDFPEHVSAAARQLMLSARGFFDTTTIPDEDIVPPREPAVGQEAAPETPRPVVKRGRRSKAEMEAEATSAAITAAVAEEAAAEPVPEEEKVTFPPGPAPAMFTATVTSGSSMPGNSSVFVAQSSSPVFGGGNAMAFGPLTMPNGMSPNAGAPSPFQTNTPTTMQVQQPAMPPAVEPVVGDGMTVDDLRAVMGMANQKTPGMSFKFLQKSTWVDGSPKAKWLTAEAVPADVRERLAAEMAQEAGL